jgi:anthranilate synthase component 1
MFKPTLEEFKKKAALGNLIPVYKEILADLDTPVTAYMKIRNGSDSFLLESVEGGEKWARYCFLGCDPTLTVSTRGGRVTIKGQDGEETRPIEAESPLAEVKRILSHYRPVDVEGLPRFSGGAVGFIGYDMVRHFECLPDNTKDDLAAPDSLFVITDTLLVFDNVAQTIKIVSNAVTGEGDLEAIYRETCGKILALEARLRVPAPCFEAVPVKGGALDVVSNFGDEAFKQAVLKIKNYILEGDVIQVVLAQRLSFDVRLDPFLIYRALRTINPSPYMYFLELGDFTVIGSSPEVLVRVEGERAEVRPIAGTRWRGKSEEEDQALEKDLLADEKERAEHIMLVDLGRNDLGRVAETGSVEVNERFQIERYSHVMHIVSNVRGRLKSGVDCYDVLAAAFPAGTLSGAPKIRAMEIIDELEPTRRGLYGGAVGYIGFDGNMDTAIAIRTLLVKDGRAHLGIGAGIVADSVPERELEETMNKGRALLKAVEMAERGLFL